MYRLVLDSCVLVSGLRSRNGASNRLLRLVALGHIRPLCSTALFLEYEAVLSRPEHRLEHGLGPDALQQFLASYASGCEGVDVHLRWRPQLNDPDDEMVLEAAVNGRADALVTHNIRDFIRSATLFGLAVKTPRDMLKEIQT
ncbi:MAG: putative toxin-antitoxin system toxin component, PIN family [Alphaproteobacteria bacterium]|nr:putative toxin-antitoxin system toxin component, PIN family [Alphaproteobacteria bacterium]